MFTYLKKLGSTFRYFWPIWIIIIGLVVAAFFAKGDNWHTAQWIAWISMGLFVLFMLSMPMNLVYGLIGTKGNIKIYVLLLIIINGIFSGIYWFAIFNKAGMTYDINQPYISYEMFNDNDTHSVHNCDTTYIYNMSGEKISYTVEEHKYQKVEYMFVLKNTFMTSLMQEPSDFFATASTFNIGVDDFNEDDKLLNQQKSELFHWLLILQVFISWIFFGVFISILYNKFRYES